MDISASSGGTQYITSSGYATSAGITAAKGYTSNQTWYAQWTLSCSGTILADGNCWNMVSGSWNFSTAQSQCPNDYSVATKPQLDTLIGRYSGGGLYSALGLSDTGRFWSSTFIEYGGAYLLYVESSSASVSYYNPGIHQVPYIGVACIK